LSLYYFNRQHIVAYASSNSNTLGKKQKKAQTTLYLNYRLLMLTCLENFIQLCPNAPATTSFTTRSETKHLHSLRQIFAQPTTIPLLDCLRVVSQSDALEAFQSRGKAKISTSLSERSLSREEKSLDELLRNLVPLLTQIWVECEPEHSQTCKTVLTHLAQMIVNILNDINPKGTQIPSFSFLKQTNTV